MPAWFDIHTLTDVMARQDEEGMLKSVHLVHKLITEEVDAGIPSDKIVVGGFSQGTAPQLSELTSRRCDRHLSRVFMRAKTFRSSRAIRMVAFTS